MRLLAVMTFLRLVPGLERGNFVQSISLGRVRAGVGFRHVSFTGVFAMYSPFIGEYDA